MSFHDMTSVVSVRGQKQQQSDKVFAQANVAREIAKLKPMITNILKCDSHCESYLRMGMELMSASLHAHFRRPGAVRSRPTNLSDDAVRA